MQNPPMLSSQDALRQVHAHVGDGSSGREQGTPQVCPGALCVFFRRVSAPICIMSRKEAGLACGLSMQGCATATAADYYWTLWSCGCAAVVT
jgi:hypothetical protein